MVPSAVTRFSTRAPSGSAPTRDSAGTWCPLTNTSSTAAAMGGRTGRMSPAGTPIRDGGARANVRSAIGATLVNRHSSSRVVGNPREMNRWSASSRTRARTPWPLCCHRGRARSHSATYPSSTRAISAPYRGRRGRFQPAVASFLELERQLLAARPHNPSIGKHVHDVGHDVVQQPLIVRDQQKSAIGISHRVHALRHDLQRIDIEARVRFVENGQPGLEYRNLEALVALLLVLRTPFVHRPVHYGLVL